MWVWSDELVDRVLGANGDVTGPVPLVAFAVASDADLDEMVREVLAESASGASRMTRPTGGRDPENR